MNDKIRRARRIRPEEAMDARRELQAAFQNMRNARTNPDFYGDERNAYELLGSLRSRIIAALAFLDAGPTGKNWDVRDRELRHELVVADAVRMERQKAARGPRVEAPAKCARCGHIEDDHVEHGFCSGSDDDIAHLCQCLAFVGASEAR